MEKINNKENHLKILKRKLELLKIKPKQFIVNDNITEKYNQLVELMKYENVEYDHVYT